MPPDPPAWHAAFTAELRRTGDRDAAAAAAGVSPRTAGRHLAASQSLYNEAQQAAAGWRASQGLPPLPGWHDYAAARECILSALRSGQDFKSAARTAGVSRSTAMRWRREDPGYDRRVLDAAAAGGGTVLSPVGRSCPGRHCGTATGYDFGCREQQCTSAKSRQVIKGREKRAGRTCEPG